MVVLRSFGWWELGPRRSRWRSRALFSGLKLGSWSAKASCQRFRGFPAFKLSAVNPSRTLASSASNRAKNRGATGAPGPRPGRGSALNAGEGGWVVGAGRGGRGRGAWRSPHRGPRPGVGGQRREAKRSWRRGESARPAARSGRTTGDRFSSLLVPHAVKFSSLRIVVFWRRSFHPDRVGRCRGPVLPRRWSRCTDGLLPAARPSPRP